MVFMFFSLLFRFSTLSMIYMITVTPLLPCHSCTTIFHTNTDVWFFLFISWNSYEFTSFRNLIWHYKWRQDRYWSMWYRMAIVSTRKLCCGSDDEYTWAFVLSAGAKDTILTTFFLAEWTSFSTCLIYDLDNINQWAVNVASIYWCGPLRSRSFYCWSHVILYHGLVVCSSYFCR